MKVIHREFCKKIQFNHTNKWNMPNPESVLANETQRLRYKRTSRDHPNNSIIKIGLNTEKNPGDLKRHEGTY